MPKVTPANAARGSIAQLTEGAADPTTGRPTWRLSIHPARAGTMAGVLTGATVPTMVDALQLQRHRRLLDAIAEAPAVRPRSTTSRRSRSRSRPRTPAATPSVFLVHAMGAGHADDYPERERGRHGVRRRGRARDPPHRLPGRRRAPTGAIATPAQPAAHRRDPRGDGPIDGKYRVEAMLGAGGMGVVVAATHVHLGTTVAIEDAAPAEAALLPEMARRFLREARAPQPAAQRARVRRALDVGQLPTGEPFIVMEMLHGRDLASQVQAQGPLSVADATTYVLQACEAVAEAHALGMVHRDLKPANLMLTRRSDGAPHVKVLDFGIATAATGDLDGGLTRADVAMGSPGYMSPEQLRSAKSVDARSDVWSLGVTLYELVAGVAPFAGDSVSSIAIAVATEEPAPLRRRARRVRRGRRALPAQAAVRALCLDRRARRRARTIRARRRRPRDARRERGPGVDVAPTLMGESELAAARAAATILAAPRVRAVDVVPGRAGVHEWRAGRGRPIACASRRAPRGCPRCSACSPPPRSRSRRTRRCRCELQHLEAARALRGRGNGRLGRRERGGDGAARIVEILARSRAKLSASGRPAMRVATAANSARASRSAPALTASRAAR